MNVDEGKKNGHGELKQKKETDSVPQLIDNIHQLIRGDELDPTVKLLLFLVENEFDSVVTPEVRRTALVLLFDHLSFPLDPHAGLVQSKLPSVERTVVPRSRVLRYVEFQTRPVEPKRLTHCPYIRLLERQEDAKTP